MLRAHNIPQTSGCAVKGRTSVGAKMAPSYHPDQIEAAAAVSSQPASQSALQDLDDCSKQYNLNSTFQHLLPRLTLLPSASLSAASLSHSFCRRKMREDVCGYSDEDTEDVTFRRLMAPDSAAYALNGPTPLDAALLTQDPLLLQQLTAGGSSSQAAAAAAVALPPSRARRVTVTTAVGGAGLALGAGVVKLVRIVSSRLQRQKRKAKGQRRASAAGAGAAAGSRRQSEARRSSAAGGRTTPRQQQR